MVLLYMFRNDPDVVVAHFDHGTRPSSAEDAKFVEAAAKKYGLPFYLGRAKLGAKVSEEQARISRYEYLEKVAKGLDGEIYTAHHADDLIESMAINLARGTGWRGLVPFGNAAVKRPFVKTGVDKAKILQYAAEHSLAFRQDPTNTEDRYLRNRLRERLKFLENDKKVELLKIYHDMYNLRCEIDSSVRTVLQKITLENDKIERKIFYDLDDNVAQEILRAILHKAGISATRPQILDFLNAIRTYGPGKYFNLPGDILVKFTKDSFLI